jgi:lysozyme
MRFLLIASLLALAACGAPSPRATGIVAQRFGDANPHDFQGSKPQHYAVHGIDLSKFQTSVDLRAARAAGVNFAYIKATEGGDQTDPLFDQHWRGAAQAGVARGAYHFYYHCRPAIEQARYFIAHVPKSRGALPPVLDIEWTPTSPTCRIRRDAVTIRKDAAIFLDAVERHYGTRPMLYTTIDFFEDNEMWKIPRSEFWLRATAAHPKDLYQGQHWSFWQYSGTGQVEGIAGRVDLNAFAGSRSAWADWLARRSQR